VAQTYTFLVLSLQLSAIARYGLVPLNAVCQLPFHALAFTGIHCMNSQRDGQAELIWVAGYIPG